MISNLLIAKKDSTKILLDIAISRDLKRKLQFAIFDYYCTKIANRTIDVKFNVISILILLFRDTTILTSIKNTLKTIKQIFKLLLKIFN